MRLFTTRFLFLRIDMFWEFQGRGTPVFVVVSFQYSLSNRDCCCARPNYTL